MRVEHPMVHAPGVYFGLPEAEYHAAFALSASGIRHLRASPLDFWARCSALNPDCTDDDTAAKTIGRAFHKRIVEGRNAFRDCYAAKIVIEDFPGCLRTMEEIKAKLRDYGGKLGGNKRDLIEGLLYHEPNAQIWDLIVEEHAQRYAGKELLDAKLVRDIEVAAAYIENDPELGKAFRGGYPEVSVFYFADVLSGDGEIYQVPVKVRFDYLKIRAVVDLKTVEDSLGLTLKKAFGRAIASYKLHVQACLYLEAAREAQKLIEQGLVYGPGREDKNFLGAVATTIEWTFLWVVQRKGVAPLAQGFRLPSGLTMDLAAYEIERAKASFADCWRGFGTDPWLLPMPIEDYDSTEIPAWIAD